MAAESKQEEKNTTTTVTIAGTAGRVDDANRMTKALFESMIEAAHRIITKDLELDPGGTILVSGGAAYADFVAVKLFMRGGYAGLRFFIPGKWESKQFTGTKDADTANRYHRAFSKVCGFSSFDEMDTIVTAPNVTVVSRKDFTTRNLDLAKSHFLIAMTWADGLEPPLSRSGTRHTWDSWQRYHTSPFIKKTATKPKPRRIHVPLSSLVSKTVTEIKKE